MNLTNKHRALLITLFLVATIILTLFNLGLKQESEHLSESYYEIKPEKDLSEEEKMIEALKQLNNDRAETNKAFNETSLKKGLTKSYKLIEPPKDYIPKRSDILDPYFGLKKSDKSIDDSKIKAKEQISYNKVNELLKKQEERGENTKSTISFSLLNRQKIYIPIPVYLCESEGKIIINITVNAKGRVTDAYLNSSSSTSNSCLVEHALEYAKKSRFNPDATKKSQIGSITFHFIGKY